MLTYLLTPWSRVLLEKLIILWLVKKFPAFYGTQRFITKFSSARHLSLSWASLIQSVPPHPTSWRSVLILSSHLRLGLPSGLFPSGFPTKTLYMPLPSPMHAICPAHLKSLCLSCIFSNIRMRDETRLYISLIHYKFITFKHWIHFLSVSFINGIVVELKNDDWWWWTNSCMYVSM